MISTTYAMAADLTFLATDPQGSHAYLTRRVSLPFAPYPGLELCLGGDDVNYFEVKSCLWDVATNVWQVDLSDEEIPEPPAAFAARAGWKVRQDM